MPPHVQGWVPSNTFCWPKHWPTDLPDESAGLEQPKETRRQLRATILNSQSISNLPPHGFTIHVTETGIEEKRRRSKKYAHSCVDKGTMLWVLSFDEFDVAEQRPNWSILQGVIEQSSLNATWQLRRLEIVYVPSQSITRRWRQTKQSHKNKAKEEALLIIIWSQLGFTETTISMYIWWYRPPSQNM